jgi:tetratricopeptide (TPR) repeat protein
LGIFRSVQFIESTASMSKRGRNLNKPRVRDKKRRGSALLTKLWKQVQVAWRHHDLPKCVTLLNQMERRSPDNPKIPLELGRMQGMLQDYESADESFERCQKLAPPAERTQLLAQAGQLARDFYEPDLAEKFFTRAVEAPDASVGSLVTFAEICERRSPERAAELIDRALTQKPNDLSAKWMRGRLLRKAGELEEAEKILQALTGKEAPPQIRARAGYDLGSLLDQAGRYDEAMEAFVLAKSMLYEAGVRQRAQREQIVQRVLQMREQITPQILRRWSDAADELQPSRRLALLGGHPRSGTTLLEQVLDAHEGVVSVEETNHFRDHVVQPISRRKGQDAPILDVWEGASTDQLQTARENYFAAMAQCAGGAIGGRVLIDKNPSLTLTVAAMVRSFPEMKFLIALRDPRDVVMSCFMQPMFPVQQVSATWLQLDAAVEEYTQLMGTWRELEPMLPGPHLTVRYEDMVADLEPVARKCLKFLGVPWDDRVLAFHEHARQKQVRSPTYEEVTRKIFTSSQGRWRNYQKFLEPHLSKLEPFVKAFVYE